MSKSCKKSLLPAFSLVELMAALAVVSVLTTLALPRYRLFIATSRQAEAHANLGIMATLQQSYHLEYSKYYMGFNMGLGITSGLCTDTLNSKQNQLGFRVTKCEELYYNYAPSLIHDAAANDGTNPDLLIYPNCSNKHDIWQMSKDRELTHPAVWNVIKQCHN